MAHWMASRPCCDIMVIVTKACIWVSWLTQKRTDEFCIPLHCFSMKYSDSWKTLIQGNDQFFYSQILLPSWYGNSRLQSLRYTIQANAIDVMRCGMKAVRYNSVIVHFYSITASTANSGNNNTRNASGKAHLVSLHRPLVNYIRKDIRKLMSLWGLYHIIVAFWSHISGASFAVANNFIVTVSYAVCTSRQTGLTRNAFVGYCLRYFISYLLHWNSHANS